MAVPDVLGRETELTLVGRVLDRGLNGVARLCVTGEAGIGKTSLLAAVHDLASARGFAILSCAPSSVESHLTFASLTDLLLPLVDAVTELPDPQRHALEAALLHRTRIGRQPDGHAVGAGTLSLLEARCASGPVLLTIDDVQWLDRPSLRALSFAIRRCRSPYAMVVTLLDGDDPSERLVGAGEHDATLRLAGLGLAPLQQLLRRSGQALDRPTARHIHEVSGGNPLFARELARSVTAGGTSASPMPSHLSVGMRARLAALPEAARDALLICSALADPTAATLQQAGVEDAARVLADAEDEGILRWDGNRVRFAHPMWREVAYRSATPGARRAVHARLSEVTHDIEERARHLALSSPLLGPATRAALEDAATSARLRGAPSHAAELLELAIARGAVEPGLWMQAALDHFAAGAHDRARELAQHLLTTSPSPSGPVRAAALNLLGEVTYLTEDFPSAVSYLEQAFDAAEGQPVVRAAAAVDLAFSLSNLGLFTQALEWTVRAEQAAALAREPAVAAEAAGAAAVLSFLTGHGVDDRRLRAALADEDPDRQSSPARWPSMSAALIHLWAGDLVRARPALDEVHRRYVDRGLDIGLSSLLARLAEAALLDGDVPAADAVVVEIEQRAHVAGTPAESVLAYACRVVMEAYRGDLDAATTAHRQLDGLTAGGAQHLMPDLAGRAALGMCLLSADEPGAAVGQLEPVLDIVVALGVGEPVVSPFFADAIEALTAVGRPDRAVPLVEMLEAWGPRADSRWATGVGARGRALLLLAQGDLDGADDALHRALAAFDVRSRRYERARTHLLLAAVQRRRRQRTRARQTLILAHDQFDLVGAAGWRDHAQREIGRLGLDPTGGDHLTPSEQRIAGLAGSGLTNAAVAVRLSISPKTVEAHLTRIYSKLDVHSRAELGRWMALHPPG